MDDIVLNSKVTIPAKAIEFKFSRSSGKGGQNVNKVSTKVEALLNIDDILAPREIKWELKQRLHHHIDSKGIFHVVSQESRSQWKNRNIVLEKLTEIFTEALKEEKERFATKPTRSSKKVRVERKKKHGTKKRIRLKNISFDE